MVSQGNALNVEYAKEQELLAKKEETRDATPQHTTCQQAQGQKHMRENPFKSKKDMHRYTTTVILVVLMGKGIQNYVCFYFVLSGHADGRPNHNAMSAA